MLKQLEIESDWFHHHAAAAQTQRATIMKTTMTNAKGKFPNYLNWHATSSKSNRSPADPHAQIHNVDIL